MINIKCELECNEDAKIYCLDCTKVRCYCQECFLLAHKASSKKNHRTSDRAPDLLNEGAATMFCSAHSKEQKKGVCLTCNQSVCGECMISAKHESHKFTDFANGFNKITSELQVELSEINKATDVPVKQIAEMLDEGIMKWKEINKEIVASFTELRQIIDKKEKEVLKVINESMEKRIKDRKELDEMKMKVTNVSDECKKLIKNGCKSGAKDYDMIRLKSEELGKIKESYTKFSIMKDMNCGVNKMPSLDPIKKGIQDFSLDDKLIFNQQKTELSNSAIIKDSEQEKLLIQWVEEAIPNKGKIEYKLLYKMTTHGAGPAKFHELCNDKGPTLTICLTTTNFILGGYAEKSWFDSSGVYVSDPTAFIYSLTRKTKHAKQKDTSKSIVSNRNYGPLFGCSCDLMIWQSNSTGENSCSSKGNEIYELPKGVDNDSYLAGSSQFTLTEMEVYSVINHS